MAKPLDIERTYATSMEISAAPPPHPLRRAHSSTNVAADFLDAGQKQSDKAKHYTWTGDDAMVPMPQSWKRSAYVAAPACAAIALPPVAPRDDAGDCLTFLDHTEASVGAYNWVKNDESPWGTLGARGAADFDNEHYFRAFGRTHLFHNEFRAWLDHAIRHTFDDLYYRASMNCRDFVALMLARTVGVTPATLGRFFSTQSALAPQFGARFSSYWYNHLGSPYRRPFDKKAFPGDIVFFENKHDGVFHVAVLQETEPCAQIIECSNANAPDMAVAINPLEFAHHTVTYVPFDIAVGSFVAHMRAPGHLTKSLSYDAFLRLWPNDI